MNQARRMTAGELRAFTGDAGRIDLANAMVPAELLDAASQQLILKRRVLPLGIDRDGALLLAHAADEMEGFVSMAQALNRHCRGLVAAPGEIDAVRSSGDGSSGDTQLNSARIT